MVHDRISRLLVVRLSLSVTTVLAMACVVSSGHAQTEERPVGIVTGTVVNASTKEPLPDVNVIIVGTMLGGVTNIEGRFRIGGIPAGSYAVRISLLGFEPAIVTDVVVGTAKPAEITVSLVESRIELGEVSVSAEYFQRLPDKPLSTQRQANEEIRRLPGGFEDVLRAVSILPGVAQVQAGRNDLIVRGGAPSENLFIVDNIQVPNINHFGTQGSSGGPLSFINLDFVNGTTFSTGGFGARYGDKLSSVLSIDLREGRTDRFGGKATLAATQFGVNVEGPIEGNGSVLFSARRSYLDFIFKSAGFAFVPEYWDFLAKGTYRLGKRDNLSVLGIAALDDIRLFNDTPEKRYDNSRILQSSQDQLVGGLTWQHLFGSGYTSVSMGYTSVEYDYIQADTLLNPIFTSVSREQIGSIRADVVYAILPKTEISAGISGDVVLSRTRLFLPSFWTNFGQELSVDATYDTAGTKTAVYTQILHSAGRLRITLGGRLDYFSLIDRSTVVAPRLSASYLVSPVLTINGSIGRYYQAPSLVWLAAHPANRELTHIRTDQAVVGIEHVFRTDTRLSLEFYQKRYTDYPASLTQPYLVLANTGAGFGGSEEAFASFGVDPLRSAASGRARGVELFLQKKLSEIPCYGILSVSYNESRFTALDGIERPGSFDQRWILNVGGGYVFNERWEFSTKFRFATGRPYTPYNADGTQNAALYNAERVKSNHSLDIRIDRRWMFSRWVLITYIDVQNVYNRKSADVPQFNKRTGFVEDRDAIGVLPSLGISAEF